jgi:hypothetical protein
VASARHTIVTVIGLAAALSGCTATVNGEPVAGEIRVDPPLVSAFNLEGLLLSADGLGEVTGAESLEVVERFREMWDEADSVPDRDCRATWTPAQDVAYDGTDWTVVRGEVLDNYSDDSDADPGGDAQLVVQAVVHFPDAEAAGTFLSSNEKYWSRCDGKTVTYSGEDHDSVWSVSDYANTEGTLTMTHTRLDGEGWACQRALAVRSNVAIDTMVCGFDVTDEAADVVGGIAEQMPAV